MAPGATLPKGIASASQPGVESVRRARHVVPDGHIVFDLIAEVLQSGTVRHKGKRFDFSCGSTIVINPIELERYAIHRRMDSAERQVRLPRAPLNEEEGPLCATQGHAVAAAGKAGQMTAKSNRALGPDGTADPPGMPVSKPGMGRRLQVTLR